MAAAITLDLFTTIVKIEVVGGILVLECKTGVGGVQTGVPPMTISGIPGAPGVHSVFSAAPIVVGKSVLVQPQQLKLTNQTGDVFLFCNLGAMRAQQKSKIIQLQLQTPPGQSLPPVNTTYYWLATSGAPSFIPSINPLFPLPGVSFGYWIQDIWRDNIGQPGSADIFLAGFSVPVTIGPQFSLTSGGEQVNINSNGKLNPSQTVFLQQLQLNTNPLLQPASFLITKATFPTPQPDSTSWVLRAGVWKKKTDVQLTIGDTWPLPPPAIQPTSKAATGGGPPSKTVTVTVSPPPANTVSFS